MSDDDEEATLHLRRKSVDERDLDFKADAGSIPPKCRTVKEEKARRLAALVAVADAYGLEPVPTFPGAYLAHCPRCGNGPGHAQTLIIRVTDLRRGTIFSCSVCGVSGARPNGLQRLAETEARAALAAALATLDGIKALADVYARAEKARAEKARAAVADELADALAAHGDDARKVCERVAATLKAPPTLRVVS
jgi:DNA-directed RNA polymerase subunit M/transcription elongation factor TFIIS